MTGEDREYCRTCDYCCFGGGKFESYCEYLLVVGKSRSAVCPAGVGCTCHSKFEQDHKQKQPSSVLRTIDTAASIGISRSEYAKIDKAAALRLYRDGKNDAEIAREFGCTSSAVRFWRRSFGLPSNRQPGNPGTKKEEDLH